MDDDYSRRREFMRLPERDRFGRLWDMHVTFARAIDAQALIKMKDDIEYLKGEIVGIGRRTNNGETLSTNEKINVELNKRVAGWAWYRDKILAPSLANIHTAFWLVLLYFVFGGKVPTP